MKNIILEFDDLHYNEEVDCMPVIEELVKANNNIVLNFFVPVCYKSQNLLQAPAEWITKLKNFVDSGNVVIGVHGFFHTTLEFENYDYLTAVNLLRLTSQIFGFFNIKFEKVFRGPHWGINANAVDALVDMGYTHLYNHVDYQNIADNKNIKSIYYNHNLKDNWPRLENPLQNPDIVVAHGHTSKYAHLNCNNGIWDVKDKVLELSTKFTCLRLTDI